VPTISVDRFNRQEDLVPRSKIETVGVTVIGVGAGGRNTAIQLAAIGVPKMQIIDFDKVDIPNITTQGYSMNDVGRPKVEVVADTIRNMTDDCELEVIDDRFRPNMKTHEAIFCCVDSISSREAIWKRVGELAEFWVDGRMLGETIRILAVADEKSRLHYPTTLFPESESNQGRCTAQSTIYAANIAAGLAVHQFTRWLRGFPVEQDMTLNLLGSDLFTE
jgi:molybdopterin/thiamine biosynthesis adenylyltransferase